MSDLFLGQSCSEAFKLISGGAAYTLQFSWQPDKVIVYNLTDWKGTAGGQPLSFWFRDQITDVHAFQEQVIDSAAGASFNFLDTATNGFTIANTDGGAPALRSLISAVSQADPCVVTTAAVHGLSTGDYVRIGDLGNEMPVARGMEQLNGNRYKIIVTDTTNFSLLDPISGETIDSTAYTAWVEGGRVVLIGETTFVYDEIDYKLTLGTAIMGANSDVIRVEAYKYGNFVDLGDIG